MGLRNKVVIDIGSSSVKAAVGRYSRGKFYIQAAAKSNIENSLDKRKSIINAMKSVMWDMDIRRAIISSAMPLGKVYCRFASFPNMADKEISRLVHYESSRYFPGDVDDMEISAVRLSMKRRSINSPVLLVGARKDEILEYEQVVRGSGFRMRFMGVDGLLLPLLIPILYPLESGPVCMVDIGKKWMNVIVWNNNSISFVRSVPIGGEDIDAIIQERLGISPEVAEAVKRGENAFVDVITLANRIIMHIVDDIYISLDYYETQFGEIPEKVILTGGSAYLKGLKDFLEEKIGVNVELLRVNESKILFSDSSSHSLVMKHLQEFSLVLALLTK